MRDEKRVGGDQLQTRLITCGNEKEKKRRISKFHLKLVSILFQEGKSRVEENRGKVERQWKWR